MRRFALHAQRRGIREQAIGIALSLTVTIALAVVSGLAAPRVVSYSLASDQATLRYAAERLRYLVVVPADDTRVAIAANTIVRQAREQRVVAPPRGAIAPVPSQLTAPERTASGGAVDPRPYVSWTPDPVLPSGSRSVTAPRLGRFPGTETFTAEQQDSVLWKLERSIPYAPRLLPTPAERDAMLREEAARWATAREQGRPTPVGTVWGTLMPGAEDRAANSRLHLDAAAGGVRLPLLSPGPSRAQRRRDAEIHAGNLVRMKHLAALAKARQDSIRRMDSIAMLTRP